MGGRLDMNDILDRINKVFRIIFEDDNLTVSDQTCAEDIEEWDSLKHIGILSLLEQEFGIEFDIDEIVSMENVGDMLKVIMQKI